MKKKNEKKNKLAQVERTARATELSNYESFYI